MSSEDTKAVITDAAEDKATATGLVAVPSESAIAIYSQSKGSAAGEQGQ